MCNVQNFFFVFDVVYVSTRMGHGDGRKTLGDEESYTIGSCKNKSFVFCFFFFFFARFAKMKRIESG